MQVKVPKENDQVEKAEEADGEKQSNSEKVLTGRRLSHVRTQSGKGGVRVTLDDGKHNILSTAELVESRKEDGHKDLYGSGNHKNTTMVQLKKNPPIVDNDNSIFPE